MFEYVIRIGEGFTRSFRRNQRRNVIIDSDASISIKACSCQAAVLCTRKHFNAYLKTQT